MYGSRATCVMYQGNPDVLIYSKCAFVFVVIIKERNHDRRSPYSQKTSRILDRQNNNW